MDKLIDLDLFSIPRALQSPVEWLTGLDKINRLYADVNHANEDDFLDACVNRLGLDVRVDGDLVDRIPGAGPVVIVANHPFGGIDGIVLASLVKKVRPDLKILANGMLSAIPQMRSHLFEVDNLQRDVDSRLKSARGLRRTIDWVREGHALIVFPAGEVSHLKLGTRCVRDPQWSPHVGAIVRHARASVVPVYFHGRNSALFQAAGLLHPRLRTLLLPRELARKETAPVSLSVGRCIGWDHLKDMHDSRRMTRYLRLATEFLRNRSEPERLVGAEAVGGDPIAPAVPGDELALEIESLDETHILTEKGDHAVYIARADQIPRILLEIGRLREETFRGVGEGTGRARDLDTFDSYYLHLFTWNRETQEVVGAYRLGLTRRILEKHGKKGLYTSTLFKLRTRFLKSMGESIELGRSFIRKEYQRRPDSLFLLWRGLCAFIAQNPQYRYLFGPVSISNDYRRGSKDLMVEYLRQNRFDPAFAKAVKARHPYLPDSREFPRSLEVTESLESVDDVSFFVSNIEADEKKIPILLKQYLKLNARLLGFNVDPNFANALDGLILVDTMQVEPRFLRRLMGSKPYESYVAKQLLNTIDFEKPVKTTDKGE